MKFLLGFVFGITLITSCQKKEKEIDLFNGEDLSGWHIDVPQMDTIPIARTHL